MKPKTKTEIRMDELFKNLDKMGPKDALAITAEGMVSYHFARFLDEVRARIPEQYAKMVARINAREPDTRLVSQWIRGETHPCPVCGRETIKTLECCSKECQGKNDRVKEARRQTCLDKFGAENCFQSEQCKAKSRTTMKAKYGVEYSSQREEWRGLVEDTNMKKYGTRWAAQSPSVRDKVVDSIIKHYGSLEAYKKFIANHAAECFEKLRQDPNYTVGQSKTENELFNWIPVDNKKSGDRTVIKPLEIDILLPDYKLAIEYDGLFWHTEDKRGKEYHVTKTDLAAEAGYQMLHIWDNEPLDKWKSVILSKVHQCQRIGARKCEIRRVFDDEAAVFLNRYHLQGFCRAKVKLGLYYNDELAEIATFSKPRYNKAYEWELIRLCSKGGVTVQGGATRLFNYFIKHWHPESVLSYANRRWSNGHVYEVLGFTLDHISPPAYQYYKQGKCYNRQQFMKHKLVAEGFDPNKTESQIMKERGFDKVYDCGNLVYVWHKS